MRKLIRFLIKKKFPVFRVAALVVQHIHTHTEVSISF